MSGLFFGLNISLKGLMVQQAGLETTAHNIANANTEGYSRQRVNLEASQPISGLVTGGGQLGSGVDIGSITRVRQQYLDSEVRNETSQLEYQKAVAGTMNQVQTVFMEPSDNGLNAQLADFWNQWQVLAADPSSAPVRTALKEASTALADTFQQIDRQLGEIQAELQTQMDDTLAEVNELAAAIADLNKQIIRVKITGENPNDLTDKRDLLLDQLSALGNVTVTNSQDASGNYTGGVDVKLGNLTLVDSSGATVISSADDLSSVKSGALGGLQILAGDGTSNSSVQYYIDRMNSLALSIARTVNEIHAGGVDLNGDAGENFFIFTDSGGNPIDLSAVDWSDPAASGLGAANLAVNPDIDADVSKIAAAVSSSLVMEGNGDIALQIARIGDAPMVYDPTSGLLASQTGGNYSIASFYHNLVTDIGSTVNGAERKVDNIQALVDQVKSQRESIMGVSLDEESAHMIQYQHAYEACAKVISIMDEMLDTLINGMKA